MNNAPTPIISNRFEVILMVILSFVVSTKLIWLQMDPHQISVTDEFYSTSLAFNRTLSRGCSIPVGRDFPLSSTPVVATRDPNVSTSPGLALILFTLCNVERLNIGSYSDLAPYFVSIGAFFTAVTARVLTSSWVGGMIAASVILSRGTILQATRIAGSYSLAQPLMCLFFLLLVFYTYAQSALWLALLSVVLAFILILNPLQLLISWPIALMTAIVFFRRQGKHNVPSGRFFQQPSTYLALITLLPIAVFLIKKFSPSAVKSLAAVFHLAASSFNNPGALGPWINASFANLKHGDLQWQLSLAVVAICSFASKWLPKGTSHCLRLLFTMTVLAAIIDGALVSSATEATFELSSNYVPGISVATISFEPILVGMSASLVWYFVRHVLIIFYPNYSKAEPPRDRIRS